MNSRKLGRVKLRLPKGLDIQIENYDDIDVRVIDNVYPTVIITIDNLILTFMLSDAQRLSNKILQAILEFKSGELIAEESENEGEGI